MKRYVMKETLVINLIGGPCSGKSTIAAELFARLKKMGVHCELASEYIKEHIYDENNNIINDQIFLFSNDLHRLKNKLNKVDAIICDGSLLLDIIYDKDHNEKLHDLIISEYKKFNNIDFFIKRGNIEFETYGRIHNLKQSKELDKIIKETYDNYGVSYIEVESRDAADKIIPIVLKKLEYDMQS